MTDYLQIVQAFGIPGGWEWIIVLIVALLIFGKRLPDVARSVGKSLNAFKKGIHEADETKKEVVDEINKAKDDVVNDIKNAADMNNSKTTD